MPTAPTLKAAIGMSSSSSARLFGHPVGVELIHVLDAGAVGHEQARNRRQPVAAEGGEGGDVGLDAQRADGIGDAKTQDEGNGWFCTTGRLRCLILIPHFTRYKDQHREY